MSENERRRKYRYNRILIETERVLDPQFADAVVFLSGAQIEMLRNVSQYLNRLETYVIEYNPGYYLTPTAEDYDSILEIVADLEETLMGNPNTIWGYEERWAQNVGQTMGSDTYFHRSTTRPPEGYVYVLQCAYVRNETGARGFAYIEVADSNVWAELVRVDALGQQELLNWTGAIVLSDLDRIVLHIESCLTGDVIKAGAWGYRMKVP